MAAESADQFEEVYSKHQIRYRLDCAIVHIKSEHEPCGVDCAIVATLCTRIMRTCACTGCVACAVVGAGARAGAVVGARAFAVAVAGLRARVRLLAPARSPTGDVAGHPFLPSFLLVLLLVLLVLLVQLVLLVLVVLLYH